MEEMRDYIVLTDEEGNEIEMDVLGYFDHKEKEYAILMDMSAANEEEAEAYIMEVVYHEETDEEEFVPVPEDMIDELATAAEAAMECDDDCDCGCDCDCDEDGEECECDYHHKDDCDCGCHD